MAYLINIEEYLNSISAYVKTENKQENELLISFSEEHISSEIFEILENKKNPNSDRENIDDHRSMLIPNHTTDECKEKIPKHIYVLDLLLHEYQSLSTEQKTVADITDRIVEQEKNIKLKITVDSNCLVLVFTKDCT